MWLLAFRRWPQSDVDVARSAPAARSNPICPVYISKRKTLAYSGGKINGKYFDWIELKSPTLKSNKNRTKMRLLKSSCSNLRFGSAGIGRKVFGPSWQANSIFLPWSFPFVLLVSRISFLLPACSLHGLWWCRIWKENCPHCFRVRFHLVFLQVVSSFARVFSYFFLFVLLALLSTGFLHHRSLAHHRKTCR